MSEDPTHLRPYLEKLYELRKVQEQFESFIDAWEKPLKGAGRKYQLKNLDPDVEPCGWCTLQIGGIRDDKLYFEWCCPGGFSGGCGAHGEGFYVPVLWLIGYLQPLSLPQVT